MSEKKGTAATRAKNKYRDKTYDRIEFLGPVGFKAEVEAAAKRAGLSRNEFIKLAIEGAIDYQNA